MTKILIVKDETIVTLDTKSTLTKLGHKNDYLRIYYENQEMLLTKNERLFLEVLL